MRDTKNTINNNNNQQTTYNTGQYIYIHGKLTTKEDPSEEHDQLHWKLTRLWSKTKALMKQELNTETKGSRNT